MRRISLLSLSLGTRFLRRLTAAKCQHARRSAGTRGGRSLTLQLLAVIAAVAGSQLLTTQSRAQSPDLYGVFLLLAGFAFWLLAEIVLDGQAARSWLRLRRLGAQDGWAETAHFPRRQPRRAPLDLRAYQLRFLAALLGLAGSYLTYQFTANNHFSLVGFWSWVASIALWVCALAPQDWLEERVDQARAFSWRDRESQFRLLAALLGLMGGILTVRGIGSWIMPVSIALWVYALLPRTGLRWLADCARAIPWRDPTLWLLLAITLLAALIRLNDLAAVPPEMTSDHVETVLDGYRTAAGERNIFFANNGGRVPFHFYAQSLLAQLPGLGHNLITIKLLTVLEGLLAIPCLYWLGCTAVGGRPPGLGRVVGLLLAALVAVSYWHIFLSRAGLRWAPTVVVSALLLGLLARALRENRRGDYVKAGLVLGFGLYTYPSVRMLPLLALFGVAQAFIFWARDWRARFRYLWHLVVMALVAFVVFMPLYRYSNKHSDAFMRRTRTRILGDSIVMDSSLKVIEALNERFPDLLLNLRDGLLMYNWRGDDLWFHGAPGKPVLDPWAGAFFVLGLAAWSARLLRRRDVFDWALPAALLITLLPAALAIAFRKKTRAIPARSPAYRSPSSSPRCRWGSCCKHSGSNGATEGPGWPAQRCSCSCWWVVIASRTSAISCCTSRPTCRQANHIARRGGSCAHWVRRRASATSISSHIRIGGTTARLASKPANLPGRTPYSRSNGWKTACVMAPRATTHFSSIPCRSWSSSCTPMTRRARPLCANSFPTAS